ncbi:uridine kinase [uncultured Desulfobacter sp.]|uniref:uridine kinase n=1 Tax=uncultured Desulfobacter sp. TaxID=240139 RepID=UPI0029F5BFC3|nr:uridine kinase [uncultured Desulfobacter sp.]
MDRRQSYVIGIAGGSGSGKTTIINRILQHTGPDRVAVIRHDWYYKHHPHLPSADRAQVNYDHPDALDTALLVKQLRALLDGQPVTAPQYDYNTHLRLAQTLTIHPCPVIIIDGILILTDPALKAMIDLKVYVDTDPDIRFIRRMNRDIEHRGRTRESVVNQYLETVKPMHDRFVYPSRKCADIIVPGGSHNDSVLDLLTTKIDRLTQ